MALSVVQKRIILGSLLLLTTVPLLLFISSQRNTEVHLDFLQRIPIGSKIENFIPLSNDDRIWGSRVTQWFKPSEHIPTTNDTELGTVNPINNKYGIFRRKILGNFENWKPSEEERRKFDGMITFYLDREFSGTVALDFVFIDGALVEKSWGYLPG